jgi:hypothetical protein
MKISGSPVPDLASIKPKQQIKAQLSSMKLMPSMWNRTLAKLASLDDSKRNGYFALFSGVRNAFVFKDMMLTLLLPSHELLRQIDPWKLVNSPTGMARACKLADIESRTLDLRHLPQLLAGL